MLTTTLVVSEWVYRRVARDWAELRGSRSDQ